jgi:hypothetical protein
MEPLGMALIFVRVGEGRIGNLTRCLASAAIDRECRHIGYTIFPLSKRPQGLFQTEAERAYHAGTDDGHSSPV